MISNKTIDGAIAIATALSDITNKSKVFQATLKHLVEQRASAEKALKNLVKERAANDSTLSEIDSKLKKATALESKLEKDSAFTQKAIDDLAGTKAEIASKQTDISFTEKKLAEDTAALDKRTVDFESHVSSTTSELKDREKKLKAAETRIEEIQNLIKR